MDKTTLVTCLAHCTDVLVFTWFSSSMLMRKKNKLLLPAGIITLCAIPVILNHFFTKGIIFPVVVVGFYAFLELVFDGTFKEKILVYCLGYVTINLAQTLCGSAFGLMGLTYDDKIVIFWVSTVLFEFALLYLVSRTWKSIKLVMSSRRSMAFFLLPVSQLLMMLVFVYHFGMAQDRISIDLSRSHGVTLVFGFVFLLSLIADGLFLDSMNKVAQSIEERERLQTLEMESRLTYEYIKNMESDINEMSRYRHDLVNTLTAAQLAIESDAEHGRKDAVQLVSQMADEVRSVTGKRYCRCNIVNCILSLEEKRMTANGIRCELRAEVPEVLGVGELDLCRVLTNLFDNAEQNCMGIEERDKRFVDSNMRVQDGYLYITVSNSFEGEFSTETKKKDKKHHGLGLKIIGQIAERNNGELLISQEHDRVSVTVTMEWKDK